jgi:hypothetical protein
MPGPGAVDFRQDLVVGQLHAVFLTVEVAMTTTEITSVGHIERKRKGKPQTQERSSHERAEVMVCSQDATPAARKGREETCITTYQANGIPM